MLVLEGDIVNKLLIAGATALAVLIGGPALAADMPLKAPPQPPPAPLWTGFYIGFNAGAAWLDDPSFTSTPGGTLVTGPFNGSLGWGETISGSSSTSFSGGFQAGYNQQINNWVLGFESDIQYIGASSSAANVFTATATLTNSFASKTPWLGTTRIRVGTTALGPNLLLYVTGGLAYGREQISGSINAVNSGFETFLFDATDTVAGYAVGGGGEWAFDRHWSLKAEYLFVQLGAAGQQVGANPRSAGMGGLGTLATDAMTLSVNRVDLSIARAGLNYRF